MAKPIKETPILTSMDAVNFYKQKAVDEKFKKKRPTNNMPSVSKDVDVTEKEYYSNGYQPLFNLMADNGQIMVQDELFEIINCVRLMDKYQLETGATDMEKLMQGEWVKDSKSLLDKIIDRVADYISDSKLDQDFNDGLKVALDELEKAKRNLGK